MILAVDIGNTQITLGVIRDGAILRVVRIHTEQSYTSEEYGIKFRQLMEYEEIDPKGFEGAVLASVVPPVTTVAFLCPMTTPRRIRVRISSRSSPVSSSFS